MTMQSLPSPILFPGWTAATAAAAAISTQDTLDAAGKYSAYVFMAKEAMTISHVGFRAGTVAGSGTLDVRIETVSATDGLPTGTLWGTNTNVAGTALNSAAWNLVALTASASISAGQVFCVKLAYNSGTSVITSRLAQIGKNAARSFPYRISNTGTPTTANQSATTPLALGSNSTTFYNIDGAIPATNITTMNANTSTLSAHGIRFQVPFKCRCSGINFVAASAGIGEYTLGIYDDGGTELSSSSTAIDINQIHAASGMSHFRTFDSPVILSPATWYRAAIYPTTTTNVGLYGVDLPSADYRSAAPWGVNSMYATRSTGGAWTDTDTDTLPLMDIIIDQLDDGVSAGGGTHFSVGG